MRIASHGESMWEIDRQWGRGSFEVIWLYQLVKGLKLEEAEGPQQQVHPLLFHINQLLLTETVCNSVWWVWDPLPPPTPPPALIEWFRTGLRHTGPATPSDRGIIGGLSDEGSEQLERNAALNNKPATDPLLQLQTLQTPPPYFPKPPQANQSTGPQRPFSKTVTLSK